MTVSPRLAILPRPQRELWPELATVPSQFVLYGGTGIALRIGHRESIDFDFFSSAPLDHRELERACRMVREGTTIQDGPHERTVIVGGVKVSFFGGLSFGRVGTPERTDDDVTTIAALVDLAGTKVKALVQRVEAKDYRDIIALLDDGMAIETILGAAVTLFEPMFNPLVAQKALTYFVGGDLASLDEATRSRLIAVAGRDLDVRPLARRSPELTA